MNNTPLLIQLFTRNAHRYSALPIFGSVLELFAQWLQSHTYTSSTIRRMIPAVVVLTAWLQRHGRIRRLTSLTSEVLAGADAHFRPRRPEVSSTVRALGRFLRERRAIPDPKPPLRSAAQREADRFACHLREMRGLAQSTVRTHTQRAVRFLEFIGFNRDPTALRTLRREAVERFVRQSARTHNRFSLLQVAATLRSLLRFEFSQGAMPHRLHEQIDTPRVYLGERLPRAVPWEQVRCLLRSMDRSTPEGGRDFAILYLAAAYGLRGGELMRLRLEDIDWRKGTLRVPQAKTRQVLTLPLTDEAGNVLAQYLRLSRPSTEYRELFLHARAPTAPMRRGAVTAIVGRRLRRSGLKLERFGAHVLRHSLAVHLLRRGVSTKAIGDTLGHRDVTSTAVYLRLGLEDLRTVGLPVPKPRRAARLLEGDWLASFPRVSRHGGPRSRVRRHFQSVFGSAMQYYLDYRRTLGRKYVLEASTLLAWDSFLHRRGAKTVGRELFEQWAKSLSNLIPTVQRKRLCIVRNFLRYDTRAHPGRFVPDLASFPKALPPRPPRWVSPAEMARVLATSARLRRSHHNPLRAQTVRVGLLLLFCCGLRIGELLRLQRRHYDTSEKLLRIEGTKFHKSRLVPLAPSVARELIRYLEQRRRRGLAFQPDSPLVWSGANSEPKAGYTATGLATTWKHLCLSAGVLDQRGRPPRLHDLRHSFAVAALHRWYEQEVDAQAKLPHLATYLGHVNAASSHYYLQFTPALRAAVSQRFQRAFGLPLARGGAA